MWCRLVSTKASSASSQLSALDNSAPSPRLKLKSSAGPRVIGGGGEQDRRPIMSVRHGFSSCRIPEASSRPNVCFLARGQPVKELFDPSGDEGISDLETVDHRRAIIPALDHPTLVDETEGLEVAAEGNDVACLRERLCVHLLRHAVARIDGVLAQA